MHFFHYERRFFQMKKIALVLVLVLALAICGCTPNTTDSSETTAPADTGVKLYWNIDRLDYSVGGSSTRPVTADGTYAVRFAVDGKIETLQVADKATLDIIDFNNFIALELNAQGVVVGAKTVSELELTAGQQSYVTGFNGTTVGCNTNLLGNGANFDITISDKTVIYDVSTTGDTCGAAVSLAKNDEITYITDAEDNVLYIYITKHYNFDLEHTDHCVCAGTAVGVGTHTCDTTTSDWQPWTDPNSMPTSGKWYLAVDVVVAPDERIAVVNLEGDLTICLHGHSLDASKGLRMTNLDVMSVTFNITDCKDTGTLGIPRAGDEKLQLLYVMKDIGHTINIFGGTITGSKECSTAGIFALNGPQTLNIYGGTLIGGTATGKATVYPNGSVMYLQKGATCNMYGGTIKDGSAKVNVEYTDYLGGHGGQIYISKSTFNMYGGTITGGKVTTTDTSKPGAGGNIYLDKGAALNLYGGTITAGEAPMGNNIYAVAGNTDNPGATIKIANVDASTDFTAEAGVTVDTSAVDATVTVTKNGTEYTVTKAAG